MTTESEAQVLIERVSEINCAQCGTRMDVASLEPFSAVQCPSCGNQDTVPARFGEFLLLNLINTGGMGGVYRARDESLGRLVAIKVMLAKLGEDAEFVANFRREAQSAARLNHPNVAQIYSYGQVRGQPYIVMELVSGHRFDRLIESHPEGLDPAIALRITLDIAEGLQAADEIGLIHGDIKPENILLDEKHKAKLVDFGIASFVDQAASAGVWGSPYYIAPEKARGRKSDSRSDIYSLGATLYHALAGTPPFEGETPVDVVKARLDADAPPLADVRTGLPKSVSDMVVRMLQREPSQRHPTYASLIGDMRRSLQEVVASGGPALRAGVSGRRVVLKKRDGSATTSGKLMKVGGVAGRVPLTPPPPTPEEEAQQAARRKRVARVTVTLLLVAAVGVAAVVMFVLARQERRQQLEARRQQLELKQAAEQAARLYAGLERNATNLVRLAARVDQFALRGSAVKRELEALAASVPAGGAATNAVDAPPAVASAIEKAAALQTLRDDVHALVGKAPGLVKSATVLHEGLLRAATLEEVGLKEAAIREQQEALNVLFAGATNRLMEGQALLAQVEAETAALRRAFANWREGAERRRAVEARAALEQADQQAVADLATQGDEMLRGWRHDEALALAKRTIAGLKTDAGRQAAAPVQQRFERVAALKAFVVEELGREPFPWGWGRAGGAREDILGADARGLKLKGREVPWDQVGIPQFLAIVEHCVQRPRTRRSTQGAQWLATAIYCHVNGGADAAKRYRAKALDALPSLAADVDLLLPAE